MHRDKVREYVRVHASASIVGSVRFHMLCKVRVPNRIKEMKLRAIKWSMFSLFHNLKFIIPV